MQHWGKLSDSAFEHFFSIIFVFPAKYYEIKNIREILLRYNISIVSESVFSKMELANMTTGARTGEEWLPTERITEHK